MKHLILILLSVFLFLGCTSTKTITVNKSKVKPVQQRDYTYKEVQKEEIDFDDNVFKIAIIFPSKVVGKYANSTINTILGYMLYQKEAFEIETFDSLNQTPENIEKSFQELYDRGFKRVIALYTKEAYADIMSLNSSQKSLMFFPLIHKSDVQSSYKHHIFGAISYENQLSELLKLSNHMDAMFYEESGLGNRLKEFYDKAVSTEYLSKSVKAIDTKYKKLVEDEALNDTTLVLNTPIIKSSIILSQLRAHDIKPTLILSTQLNYNPLLVSLTQFEDRVNFITANSIENTNNVLTETLSLLDAEIKYNWVNYSSLVGINYFFSLNEDNLIQNSITDNQVDYGVTLYNSTAYGFQKIVF